jgi:hypothetical protein
MIGIGKFLILMLLMIIEMKKKKFKHGKEKIFHLVLEMYVIFNYFYTYNLNEFFFLLIFIKYVVKILMGGVDSWFDDLDERKVTTDGYGRPTEGSGRKRKKRRCIIL